MVFRKWYDYIDDRTLADAIMDRLSARVHKIDLKEESLNKQTLSSTRPGWENSLQNNRDTLLQNLQFYAAGDMSLSIFFIHPLSWQYIAHHPAAQLILE
jgi:hypothetical protein